jgi:imidazolonepropionase-like amidohydrolase
MLAASLVLVIANVTVIDGPAARPNVSVLIRNGVIAQVGNVRAVPAGAQVIDGAGKFLIPGLWDMHTHVVAKAEEHFPRLLRYGITGIREMHTEAEDPFARIAEARKLPHAPRIVAAGRIVDGPIPAHPASLRVLDAADARAAVSELRRAGAAFLKTYETLPPDAYTALLDEAARVGLPVAGHIPFLVPLDRAVAAGHRSVEHLSGLFVACSLHDDAWRQWAAAAMLWTVSPSHAAAQLKQVHTYAASGYSSERCLASFRTMARLRVWHCPTLTVLGDLQAAGFTAVYDLHQAGGKLLAGTDAGNVNSPPGESLHRELELLVEAGLTPGEALDTATRNAVAWVERNATISSLIRPGRAADLVLLERNPLDDIRHTQSVWKVLRAGQVAYDAEERRKP